MIAVSEALLDGKVFDPSSLVSSPMSLAMGNIGDLAGTGPTHHTIAGAFQRERLANLCRSSSAQRLLWAADSKTQKMIALQPTHGGTAVESSRRQEVGRPTKQVVHQ